MILVNARIDVLRVRDEKVVIDASLGRRCSDRIISTTIHKSLLMIILMPLLLMLRLRLKNNLSSVLVMRIVGGGRSLFKFGPWTFIRSHHHYGGDLLGCRLKLADDHMMLLILVVMMEVLDRVTLGRDHVIFILLMNGSSIAITDTTQVAFFKPLLQMIIMMALLTTFQLCLL